MQGSRCFVCVIGGSQKALNDLQSEAVVHEFNFRVRFFLQTVVRLHVNVGRMASKIMAPENSVEKVFKREQKDRVGEYRRNSCKQLESLENIAGKYPEENIAEIPTNNLREIALANIAEIPANNPSKIALENIALEDGVENSPEENIAWSPAEQRREICRREYRRDSSRNAQRNLRERMLQRFLQKCVEQSPEENIAEIPTEQRREIYGREYCR